MVHIVVDTKGAGRIVGVFDDAARAERIRQVDPSYFRVVPLELNAVNTVAVDWLPTTEKRKALRSA